MTFTPLENLKRSFVLVEMILFPGGYRTLWKKSLIFIIRGENKMKIEGNEKEIAAMKEFHKGNRSEGLKLQEEFASEFRKEYVDKDHCPCLKACRYHGNCKECVAIHRAHQEHVPNCMRPLINKKLKILSELTEHTLAKEIEPPKEVLRKDIKE